SWEVATKANKWQGRNITRWQNQEFDDIHKAAQVELDPIKRTAILIKLNEMVINGIVVIPVVARPTSTAVSNKLVVQISGWDNNTGDLANWYRAACTRGAELRPNSLIKGKPSARPPSLPAAARESRSASECFQGSRCPYRTAPACAAPNSQRA